MRVRLFSVLLALFTTSLRVSACPGCKEAIKGSGGFWGSSFNLSIFFMLGTVLSLIAFVSYKVYGVIKREQAATAKDPESMHASHGYWMTVTLPVCGVVIAVLLTLGSVGSAETTEAETQYATTESVQSDIAGAQKDMLVTFKSETCSICRQMKPVLDEVANGYTSKMKLVYVNTADSQPLVQQFKVDNLPCSIMIRGGKETGRIEGMATEQEIRSWIDERLK